jgi:hypothetical protein
MSCSDYRWEQLHMQGEEGAEDYIFACRSAAKKEIDKTITVEFHNFKRER